MPITRSASLAYSTSPQQSAARQKSARSSKTNSLIGYVTMKGNCKTFNYYRGGHFFSHKLSHHPHTNALVTGDLLQCQLDQQADLVIAAKITEKLQEVTIQSFVRDEAGNTWPYVIFASAPQSDVRVQLGEKLPITDNSGYSVKQKVKVFKNQDGALCMLP